MQYKNIFISLAGVAAALVIHTTPGVSQTRFRWPNNTVDINRYTTVEQCLAGASRIRDSTTRPSLVARDTALASVSDVTTPVPPKAQLFARQCGAQFDANTFPLTDPWELLVQLSLLAGEDAKASTIVQRRIGLVDPDSVTKLTLVLDSSIAAYASSFPIRFRKIDSLITQIPPLIPRLLADLETLAGTGIRIMRLMGLAEQAEDTFVTRSIAHRIIDEWNRLPDSDPMAQGLKQFGSPLVLQAHKYLSSANMLDSLKKGTAAYLSIYNDLANKAGLKDKGRVGEQATPIVGDFWFTSPTRQTASSGQLPQSPSTPVRPTPGKVSLIVFFLHGCDSRTGAPVPPKARRANCFPQYAALQRLSKQYPELDITIVSQTYGFFSWMPPMSPAQEADSLRAWWLGFHKIPATLAVTETAFWTLESPDNRRINELSPNVEAYQTGRILDGRPYIWPGTAFLVDPDGVIIHSGLLASGDLSSRLNEREFGALINVLMARTANARQPE